MKAKRFTIQEAYDLAKSHPNLLLTGCRTEIIRLKFSVNKIRSIYMFQDTYGLWAIGRSDGPCIILNDGYVQWRMPDNIQSVSTHVFRLGGKPSVIWPDGYKTWTNSYSEVLQQTTRTGDYVNVGYYREGN